MARVDAVDGEVDANERGPDVEDSGDEQEELTCTAYFWQGRDAGAGG